MGLTNAIKHNFEYKVRTLCGISKVKLLGKLDDWLLLKKSTLKLNVYGLKWWT